MSSWNWVIIGSGKCFLPGGTKALTGPVLAYYQSGPVPFIWEQFHLRYLGHQSLKLARNYSSKISFSSPNITKDNEINQNHWSVSEFKSLASGKICLKFVWLFQMHVTDIKINNFVVLFYLGNKSEYISVTDCSIIPGSLHKSLKLRHNEYPWRLKPPTSRLFNQSFVQAQSKGNIKALR